MANEDQIAYWNAAQHWVTDVTGHDEMLEPLGRLAHTALDPSDGERILDIGCGTGATTLALAADVGPSGSVVGCDVSETLLGVARERAADAANVSFVEADAQVYPFEHTFDAAFSRFGVMFFEDPVAAFENIANALKPKGRLAFVCWQDAADNEWWSVAADAAVRLGVTLPPLADPLSPGPFSLSDADRLKEVLSGGGFTDIELDDVRMPALIGGRGSMDTALGFIRRSRLGSAIVEGSSVDESAEKVFDAIAEALEPYLTPEGVQMMTAVWVAKARRP